MSSVLALLYVFSQRARSCASLMPEERVHMLVVKTTLVLGLFIPNWLLILNNIWQEYMLVPQALDIIAGL